MEIICTSAPSMPSGLKMKKPSVTKPMWAIEEAPPASSCVGLHQGDEADVPTAISDRVMMNRPLAWLASGAIGSENRRKP